MYIGCHLSVSAGYAAAVDTARSIGANTFAFFTRNPRGSRAKAEDPADAQAAMELLNAYEFGSLVAHGAYTMNLCTADPEARRFAADVLADDLRRMAALPGNFYNFHPGSHTGQGTEDGIRLISEMLNAAGTKQSFLKREKVLLPHMQIIRLCRSFPSVMSAIPRLRQTLQAAMQLSPITKQDSLHKP